MTSAIALSLPQSPADQAALAGLWSRLSNREFWDDLVGTTIKLSVVFWLSVILVDSVMWGVSGIDPLDSIVGKIVVNSFGALLTVGITWLLLRLRALGILTKTVVAFALSAIAAPIYGMADYYWAAWCVYPESLPFNVNTFGLTMVASTAMFFGWSCLFIALVYSFDVRDRERKLAAAREEALGAQMRALRYQISPHFLFNTLNAIAGLVEEGATDQAGRMVMSLSGFLRTTLEIDPLADVALEDEIALQEEYLAIERVRFPDRLSLTLDIAAETRSVPVPVLILQPLVENAVRHGVARSTSRVTITIAARMAGERLVLTVENSLPDQRAAQPGFGIGLRNVAERIQSRYGGEGAFSAGVVNDTQFRAEVVLPGRAA